MPRRSDRDRRVADLLAALARSANMRLARRETGISAYWAYRRRKADPDFDALRATCNVRAAAAASGVSATGAYRYYHAGGVSRGVGRGRSPRGGCIWRWR